MKNNKIIIVTITLALITGILVLLITKASSHALTTEDSNISLSGLECSNASIIYYVENETTGNYEQVNNAPNEEYVVDENASHCDSNNCYMYFDKEMTETVWNFDYYEENGVGKEQLFTVPKTGKYKVELWGASGGHSKTIKYGKGSYVFGNITLDKSDSLFVYIGAQGPVCQNTTSYNGGGASASCGEGYVNGSGGGATDIRKIDGDWNNENSLRSRIIVAAGGAGETSGASPNCDITEINGGGLIGYNQTCNSKFTAAATQISGNAFGVGGQGQPYKYGSYVGSGAGGGGWYGGLQGVREYEKFYSTTSGSGSSYISGHTGCVAVKSKTDTTPKNGCTTGTTDKSCSISPYGYEFTNTKMIDGAGYSWTNVKGSLEAMPNPNGGYYASGVGHSGNGYAKITYLGN